MASNGVFNGKLCWSLDYIFYITPTSTFLFSSSGAKSLDQLTCIFLYLKGRKQDHSAQGTVKMITCQISFISFFNFWPQEGFLYGMEGWLLERDCPPHSVPVYARGHFSMRSKRSRFVGRAPLSESCTAAALGESTGFMHPVRKDTQVNLPGQCGNSQSRVQRKQHKQYLTPNYLPTFL